MNIRTFQFNAFQENTYIIWKEAPRCVIVDPAFYSEKERLTFFNFLDTMGLRPESVLLTHGHPDHIFGVKDCIDRYGCTAYLNPEDGKLLEISERLCNSFGITAPDCSFAFSGIRDADTIETAGFCFKVIHTPGHSPGSCCMLENQEKVIFTGDTLFAGTIGRTDLPFGNYDDEIRSIMEKLAVLDPALEIRPGHASPSTIGYERTHNPMLEPFNEPETAEDEELTPVEIHA